MRNKEGVGEGMAPNQGNKETQETCWERIIIKGKAGTERSGKRGGRLEVCKEIIHAKTSMSKTNIRI